MAIILIFVDYLILLYLDAYLFNYFIVLHFVFLFINMKIIYLYKYLEKQYAAYLGIGIMAALIFKMFFALGKFVILHIHLHMSDIQVVNFLFVYFCYTILFLFSVLKSEKLKK